ncbi:sugar ABC transporter permease, partial [bacterium M00.F.Ca.ET.180.01.1.1]
GLVRPWLFVGPAMIILTIYLIYPVIETLRLSFLDRSGANFVGLANYEWAFGDHDFRNSILNNVLWLAVVPAACTFLGLIIAVLTDKIWWSTIAKSLIFLPLAISFVGASVIWKFIYEYR